MAQSPLQPPPPLPQNVRRINPDGTPTRELIAYEVKLQQFLRALAAALPAE